MAPGRDVSAMQSLLTRTPNVCRQLRAQITGRIAALQERAAAPAPTPRPTIDQCASARSQWNALRDAGALQQVRAFLASTPLSCSAERSAAQQRLTTLEAQATPTLPAEYEPALRAAMSPAAREWLATENARAGAYFRPHTITEITLNEIGEAGRGGRRCSLELLPETNRRNAVQTQATSVTRRSAPMIVATRYQSRTTNCTNDESSQSSSDSIFVSAGVGGFTAHYSVGGSRWGGAISGVLNIDPNDTAPTSFNIQVTQTLQQQVPGFSSASQNVNETRCQEQQRFAVGEWNVNFPFVIVRLSCERRRINSMSGSGFASQDGGGSREEVYFVPDLFATVQFVGATSQHATFTSSENRPFYVTYERAPSDVVVELRDNGVRVTCLVRVEQSSDLRYLNKLDYSRVEWVVEFAQ